MVEGRGRVEERGEKNGKIKYGRNDGNEKDRKSVDRKRRKKTKMRKDGKR